MFQKLELPFITNLVTKLLLLFLLFGCQKNRSPKSIEKIDLVTAYENKTNINLSDIAESVEYIRLESAGDYNVGAATRVFADEDYLVVISHRQQYIFDRKTGNFIREIGEYGIDPKGYRNTRFNLAYNQEIKSIYASSWDGGIIEYSINGEVTNKFKKPAEIPGFRSFAWINDSVYVASVTNIEGNQKAKLVLFKGKKRDTSIIPNTDFYEDNPNSVSTRGESEGWFYRFNGSLFLKGCFNDTVFEIKDNSLLARYEINSGDLQLPSVQRDFIKMEDWKKYHFVMGAFESKYFLYFTLNFNEEIRIGIYDKRKKLTKIANSKSAETFYFGWKKYGFINDIDNFIQFCPHYMNENNEIVASVDAYEVVNWFKENSEKAAKLPPNLQKLKNMKETDNPVVMIAKLKE